MKISRDIVDFFHNQGCVIVSTIDKRGFPHSSCKGIIKIEDDGKLYLMDVYRARTLDNLRKDPRVSVTAIDEHKFTGFCLKGKARLIVKKSPDGDMVRAWEDRITSRLTRRLLKNIREEKGRKPHPEAFLPAPEYIIAVKVEEIVDLAPQAIKNI